MKRLHLFICSSSLLLDLGGCSFVSYVLDFSPTTELKQLNVVAEVNANQNMATALDVVFVFDKNALAVLPKTGPDWFTNKNALINGLASGVAVLSLQIPPASTVSGQPLPKNFKKAIAVLSYANYLSAEGQAVGNLTPFKCALLTLTSTQISYTSCS